MVKGVRVWPGRRRSALARPAAPLHTACHAPFTSLNLDPRGAVRACCRNSWQLLGNVTEQSLLEIWRGPRVAELRRALERDDFNLGCESCRWEIERASEAGAYARTFDGFPIIASDPEWPQHLDLSLTNTCNLQCVMCNGELSSSIRAQREHLPPLPKVYDDRFFDELTEFLPHLTQISFVGGEPFLGLENHRVWDLLMERGLRPACQVTTNGTVFTPKVERILEHFPVSVSVSIDGHRAETVESIRVGADHAQLWENIERFRAACLRSGTNFSLNYCLMTNNWREFGDLLLEAEATNTQVVVTMVTAPATFSLYHLSEQELAHVVRTLEEQDAHISHRLGPRNRRTWEVQLQALRAHLDRRDALPASADGTHQPGVALVTAREIALDRAWPGGVAEIDVDPNLLIRRIDPDPADVFGMDLSDLVGHSVRRLLEPMAATFGQPVGSQLDHRDGGIEDRRLVVVQDGEPLEVSMVMAPTDDGEGTRRWFVTVRPTTLDSPVGAEPGPDAAVAGQKSV